MLIKFYITLKVILKNYTGDFEMVGCLVTGDFTKKTHIRIRNNFDYEAYINSINQGYVSDGSIFNGYINILNTPEFKRVNRRKYGNGCDFKHEIFINRGNNCFIPIKGFLLSIVLISQHVKITNNEV